METPGLRAAEANSTSKAKGEKEPKRANGTYDTSCRCICLPSPCETTRRITPQNKQNRGGRLYGAL